MTRFQKRWVTIDALRQHGDAYEGVISGVSEQELRNRWTGGRSARPVISFTDGWLYSPNTSALAPLIAWFGPDSDDWHGRRFRICLRQVERVDRKTGELKFHAEKAVMCADPHARRRSPSASLTGLVGTPIPWCSTPVPDSPPERRRAAGVSVGRSHAPNDAHRA